jgi:hypothetical protein
MTVISLQEVDREIRRLVRSVGKLEEKDRRIMERIAAVSGNAVLDELTLNTLNVTTIVVGEIVDGVDVGAWNADQFVVMALSSEMPNERVLTAGDGIDVTDGGAGSTVTIAVDVTDILGTGIGEDGANNLVLPTPGTLTVSTGNAEAAPHTHAVTSSSNPGVAASILATDASGNVTVQDITAADDMYLGDILYRNGDTNTYINGNADQWIHYAGGAEFMRFTEAAQDETRFNNAGADIDFIVEASGVADAFQVLGSNGQITLGALGAGFVQSSAGGVLSSAAIGAGDLPAHTHAGAGQGGQLDWDDVWSDAVHTHANAGEGGATISATLYDAAATVSAVFTHSANIALDDGVGDSPVLQFVGGSNELATLYFDDTARALVTTIEDNQAIAYSILDDGAGDLFMQIVTTTGSEAVVFNNGGDDVDFRVEGTGEANALAVQGSDGFVGVGTAAPGARLEISGGRTLEVDVDSIAGIAIVQSDDATTSLDINNVAIGGDTRIYATEDIHFRTATVDPAATIVRAGTFYINESTNADMAGSGLTINQGVNDDEILAVKSSDIDHPFTDLAENDTYGTFTKANALGGGLQIRGYRDADGDNDLAVQIAGFLGEAADTTKDTSGRGIVEIFAAITDGGTGIAVPGADANVLTIRVGGGTTRFIFDVEGSAHADVEWTTFSEHDDIALLGALEREFERRRDPARAMVGGNEDRHVLEDAKIVTFYDDGPRGMVNTTRLAMLLVGALRQAGERIALLEGA